MPSRAIFHLDMDTFFVSVERLLDPALAGKPVVVGGLPGGRGVVASASYEARLYGIRSAMPMSEALRRCRSLVVVRGHGREYVAWSRKVRQILDSQVPVVEQASIDEFYGDLTGTGRSLGSPAATVQRLLARIRQETGLPCSAALGSSKLVAKVAIRWAKPNGFVEVPAGSEAVTFAPLEIAALPGIGPVTGARLERLGVRTLGELAAYPEEELRVLFGRTGPGLGMRARGEDSAAVIPSWEARSLGHETTFPRDITDAEQLRNTLWELAAQVGFELRQERLAARTLTLRLRTADFSTTTRSRTLPVATNRDYDLARVAEDLFNQHHRPGKPLRLLGVRASNLVLWCEQQLLFEAGQQQQAQAFYEALDAIRDRYGFGAITAARTLGPQPRTRPTADDNLTALGNRQTANRRMSDRPRWTPGSRPARPAPVSPKDSPASS